MNLEIGDQIIHYRKWLAKYPDHIIIFKYNKLYRYYISAEHPDVAELIQTQTGDNILYLTSLYENAPFTSDFEEYYKRGYLSLLKNHLNGIVLVDIKNSKLLDVYTSPKKNKENFLKNIKNTSLAI